MISVAWLHGYTMRSSIFEPVWRELPAMRHIGIDLPGHGRRSDESAGDLPTTASRVSDEMRSEEARVLVGLSYGSCVALQVALDHPEALDALVLAAPTLAGATDDPPARAKYLLMRRLHLMGVRGRRLTDVWMSDPPAIFTGLTAHPDAYARMRDIVAEHSFAELGDGSMARVADTVHTDADLAGLAVPTLVITGTADMPRFVDNARRIAAQAATVTTEVVPGAGHLPLIEEPAHTCAAIEAFLHRAAVAPGSRQGAVGGR